jgi:hypothetical protein
MGAFQVSYDSAADNWFVDMGTRFHGRWTIAVRGDSILGDLREMPARRLVRRIAVGKCDAGIPQCPK